MVPVAIQSFAVEDLFKEQLKALRAAFNSSQGPEIEIDGRRFVNFSSNDYLGLANDSRLCKAAIPAINEFGVGVSGAILRVFPHSNLRKLESHLEWAGRPRAVARFD